MKYFIDANVLVDLVTMREPFGKIAAILFETAKIKNWTLYSSAISITTTHYILQKQLSEKESNAVVGGLLDLLEIIPVDGFMLRKAVSHPIVDFEDAVQFECAASIKGVDGIITRNKNEDNFFVLVIFF
jgi:predicted nucleic acid-binding protein